MMKRLIVMGIVAAMVMGLAVTASATLDTAWQIQLRTTDLSSQNYGATLSVGTGTASSANGSMTDPIVMISMAGTTPPQIKDVRAAAPALTIMTWSLRVNAGATYASTRFRLSAWDLTATAADLNQDLVGPDAFTVKLYQGTTALFTFLPSENGTSLAPQFTGEYDIQAGGSMNFSIVREPLVPEPGSMLAMLSGLVGLAGFAIRRKR